MKDNDILLLLFLGGVAYYLYSRGSTASSTAPITAPYSPTFTTAAPSTNIIEGTFHEIFGMQLSANGAAFIKQQEGLSLTAYPDANGYSIGYGHFITGQEASIIGRNLNSTSTITQSEANALFTYDTQWAINAINSNVKVSLSQNQFDALVDFTFNEGATSLQSSTLLRDLNNGDYAGAASQFHLWNISSGRVNQSLAARRGLEQTLFTSPDTATNTTIST